MTPGFHAPISSIAAWWFAQLADVVPSHLVAVPDPAVTVGRMFSDTFAGIAPGSAPGFIVAQIIGGLVGLALVVALYPDAAATADDVVIPHPAETR
jgi:glycerol uptake facilitator-like aquaporin